MKHLHLWSVMKLKAKVLLPFKTCQQRFPTEDHLMIHRHKHEMTLKFPSIKNDNMLSGELHAAAEPLGRVPLHVCVRG